MGANKGWLEKFLAPSRAKRRPAPEFVAYRWAGPNFRMDPVRNISATGVYVVTEEKLPPGTFVSIMLQREGPLEKDPERRITTQARLARRGDDGMGLAFVTQHERLGRQWESLFEGLVAQVEPKEVQDYVKLYGAVEFLRRICPNAGEEVGQLLKGRLSNHKIGNALEIALWAEHLLLSASNSHLLRADPHKVVRILEEGTCTDEIWLQHCWGGLLACSCSEDSKDDSDRNFVELFSQMVTFEVRTLTVVCTRAIKVGSNSGAIAAKPLACDIEEIIATTGSRGVNIDRDLQHLVDLGLIEKKSLNSPTLLRNNQVYITPSSLGLELHARCNGHRGAPQDFYAARPPRRV
ncbi:MAG TPA: PilZ domain-containing protein [Terracidiphilus sp.]|nr:PilZ domain-containing protein [Terracidiphilus sp.]